jgi:hypothetical protein
MCAHAYKHTRAGTCWYGLARVRVSGLLHARYLLGAATLFGTPHVLMACARMRISIRVLARGGRVARECV